MKDFFRGVWFKVLVVIAVFCLGMVVFEASTGNLSAPSALLGTVLQPVERALSSVSDAVGGFLDPLVHGGRYKTENEQLKEQVAQLQNQMVDYNNQKQENEQLREIAGIKQLHAGYELEPASVIARGSEDDFGGFTINKGSLCGVEKDDAVITDAGLVGLVVSVAPTYSLVSTILNPDLAVSGVISQSGVTGVVTGELSMAQSGRCKMEHIEKYADVHHGDLVITSGSNGLYPGDLIIGSITEICVQENGISSYAVVSPVVDVKTVNNLSVVKNFQGKGTALS